MDTRPQIEDALGSSEPLKTKTQEKAAPTGESPRNGQALVPMTVKWSVTGLGNNLQMTCLLTPWRWLNCIFKVFECFSFSERATLFLFCGISPKAQRTFCPALSGAWREGGAAHSLRQRGSPTCPRAEASPEAAAPGALFISEGGTWPPSH